MAFVSFSSVNPMVQVNVPECPAIIINDTVVRAAIEFCEKSTFWRYSLDNIPTVDGVDTYTLEPPLTTVVSDIIWATYNDTPLTEKTESGIQPYVGPGIPTYFTLSNPRELQVAPEPGTGGVVKLRVALKPAPNATTIEEYVLDEWSEAFQHGALQRLYAMPKKPWSDPQLSIYHAGQFQQMVDTALNHANNSGLDVSYTVQYGGI